MEIHKTQQQIAEEWLAIAIENWQKELLRLKIGSSQDLYHSFHGKVIAQASTVQAVELAYAWYGQMVDMGAGRGTKSGDQKDNATMRRLLGRGAGHDRKPKPWYTKGKSSIAFQTHRLKELLGESIANETIQNIADSLSLNHIIRFH